MIIPGRYGVALSFPAPIIKAGGDDFAATGDWTPAAGDVKVSKDLGNVANITTLPSAIGGVGSVLWTWPLSATEMEARHVAIQVVDAATKAVKDQGFVVDTLPLGAIQTGKASAGGAATITIGTGRPIKPGQVIEIHGGTNSGDSRYVLSYDGGTGVVTMESNWAVAPDLTSLWTLWPSPTSPGTTLPSVVAASLASQAQTDVRTAVGLAAANLDTQLSTIDNFIDTEVADIVTRITDVQSRIPAALIAGRIDASIGAAAADTINASALAADAANEIRDAIFARAFSAAYGSLTFDEMIKIMSSVMAGIVSGAGTTTMTFRNLANTANTIVATVDATGNRSAVTRTP